jgi:hypothetical protein
VARIAWAGLALIGVAGWAAPARALTIRIDCSRVSARQRPELSARMRLTLAGLGQGPRAVSVECDAERAWIVWQGAHEERLAVDERRGLVEGVLAALEARARAGAEPAPEPTPPLPAGKPAAAPPPKPASPPPPAAAKAVAPATSKRHAAPLESGGIGLGATAEPWGSAGAGFGGRLDVGLGLGPLVAVASEQLRAGSLRATSELTFSTLLGAAWGAPWSGRAHFGVDAAAGLEWFRADNTDSSAIFDVGARAAWPTGTVAWWIGADARLRAHQEASAPELSVELPRVTAVLSIGAVLLAR